MAKLMWVLGIVLAAVGAALGLMTILSPGRMQAYGLLPDTAAILLVGGILSLGFGSVINAIVQHGFTGVQATETEVPVTASLAESAPAALPNLGRRAVEATAATAAVTTIGAAIVESAAAKSNAATKSSVADTIAALDEAKADIKKALGGMEGLTRPSEPTAAPVVAPAVAEEIPPEPSGESDSELYVVEEKIIRGRPARILSDETVEAETDEGWMRFENLEHLNEYLDSVEADEA